MKEFPIVGSSGGNKEYLLLISIEIPGLKHREPSPSKK